MKFNMVILKSKRETGYNWEKNIQTYEDYYYSTEKGLSFDAEVLYMSPDIRKNDSEAYDHYDQGYRKISRQLDEGKINKNEAIAMAKALENYKN